MRDLQTLQSEHKAEIEDAVIKAYDQGDRDCDAWHDNNAYLYEDGIDYYQKTFKK